MMLETIGDYDVRLLERVGSIVRYAATHVVLPRRAIIELLDADAPQVDAVKLMRRACMLDALQHPAVPRIYECGRLGSRPWIAIAHDRNSTLRDELRDGRLQVREALTLLEDVGAVLAHAHARGVLHGNITATAIVRTPALRIQKWESARTHDTELSCDALDGSDDVLALGKSIAGALDRPEEVPGAVRQLIGRLLAADASRRPTAVEVVKSARALREAMGLIDRVALTGEVEEPEIEIQHEPEEEVILLEQRRPTVDRHAG